MKVEHENNEEVCGRKPSCIYLGNLLNVAEFLAASKDFELVGCILERNDEEIFDFIRLGEKHNFPVLRIIDDEDICLALAQMGDVDLGIIANFGIILSAETLKFPKRGFVNAHLGLLPQNPGRHPILNALKNQESQTGITLHQATSNVDSGLIIDQQVLPLTPELPAEKVFDSLSNLIPPILSKQLPFLLS